MRYIDAIKGGFGIINRNWQLVLMHVVMVILSSIGFIIIVGIPLAIAFIVFGIDFTEFASLEDILRALKYPSEIISKYFSLFLIVVISFFLYLLTVAILGIFIFAGSIGIICLSLTDPTMKFSMKLFFEKAKGIFLRLLGFTTLIGIIFIITAFSLGILGGGIASLVSFAQSQDSTLALFLGTFFSLILIVIVIIIILGILSITLYGIASLGFNETGPFASVKEAFHYLIENPSAFWLYTILFIGYFIASFLLILLSYPFTILPVIGAILSFPYQLISYAFETYLGLTIIATILIYYYETRIQIKSSRGITETQEGADNFASRSDFVHRS
ncbi:MAG: hypothetical protein HXY53_07225 [Nitrospirae bacterium]|nr:hypothetical protein [Nitrospirota bacterium]